MNRRPQAGFTLVELMMTVLAGAILLTIAVPSFQTLIRNNRLATQVNDFVSVLQYARSEAARRRQTISLLPKSGTNNWAGGWTVWVDLDSNGVQDDDSNGDGVVNEADVLRSEPALSGGFKLTAGSTAPIQYAPTGFIIGDSCASAAYAFCADLCKKKNLPGRRVFITMTGRVETVSEYTCP